MKIIFINILIILSSLTYGQSDSTDSRLTAQKIIGKWVGQKIEQYSDENKLITTKNKDKLFLNKDFTYSWTSSEGKKTGKWNIDSFERLDTKVRERMIVFEDINGESQGGIGIYKFTKDTLILRMFRMVGTKSDFNNSIDMFFIKSQ